MEDTIKTIIENLSGNPLYLVVAGGLVLFFILVMLKKLFKLAMIIVLVALVYLGYLFMTEENAIEQIKDKLDKGKSAIETIDKATEDIREEAVDKIINEME